MSVRPDTRRDKASRPLMAVCLLVIACGLFLRLYLAATTGLWGDEIFTVYWVKQSFSFIWGHGRYIEANPPLYYSILWAWTRLFGDGEVAVRMPSIIGAGAMLLGIFYLGRRLFSLRVGLIAAALLAVNPMQILIGTEARSYSLQEGLIAFILLQFCLLFETLQNDDNVPRRCKPWLPLSIYASECLALLYTHYVGLLFIGACFTAGAIMLIAQREKAGPNARKVTPIQWIATHFAIGLVGLLAFTPMLALNGGASIAQVPPPSIDTLDYPAQIVLGIAASARFVEIPLFLGMLVACAVNTRQRYTLVASCIIAGVPFFFLFALTAVSFWHSIFLSRVMVCLPVCFWLAAAVLVDRLDSDREKIFILAALGSIVLIQPPIEVGANSWKNAARLLHGSMGTNDRIVFAPREEMGALTYYAPDVSRKPLEVWVPFQRYAPSTEDYLSTAMFHPRFITTADLLLEIRSGQTVWLVDSVYRGLYTIYLQPLTLDRPAKIVDSDPDMRIYRWN